MIRALLVGQTAVLSPTEEQMRQAALKVQPLKPVRRAELQQLDDNQLVTAHLVETPLAFDEIGRAHV